MRRRDRVFSRSVRFSLTHPRHRQADLPLDGHNNFKGRSKITSLRGDEVIPIFRNRPCVTPILRAVHPWISSLELWSHHRYPLRGPSGFFHRSSLSIRPALGQFPLHKCNPPVIHRIGFCLTLGRNTSAGSRSCSLSICLLRSCLRLFSRLGSPLSSGLAATTAGGKCRSPFGF